MHKAREPAKGVVAEDLPQDAVGKCEALRRTPGVVHLVAAGEKPPVTVMDGLQRPRRRCRVAVAEAEIGRVEDAILIPVQEFTDLFPVAAGEIPDARSRVDGEIGMGVEALRQLLQVILVAARGGTRPLVAWDSGPVRDRGL